MGYALQSLLRIRLMREDRASGELTAARQALARKFEQEMEIQLNDLNMAGTKFRVTLPACPPGPLGRETAAFSSRPTGARNCRRCPRSLPAASSPA